MGRRLYSRREQTEAVVKIHIVSVPPFLVGEQISVPNFEKRVSEKKRVLGKTFRVPAMDLYMRGFTMFLAKKSFLKIKCSFEGSILNVDLGLF